MGFTSTTRIALSMIVSCPPNLTLFEPNVRAYIPITIELNNWLINAFNGEWLKVTDAKPASNKAKRDIELVKRSGITVSNGQTLPLSGLSGLDH